MSTPTPPEQPQSDPLQQIADSLPPLLDEVTKLGTESGAQFVNLAQRARSNKRMIVGLAVSVAFDIALSIVLGFGFVALHSSNGQIAALTARLNTAQTTQRQNVLCPLYTLILASDTPAARAAARDKTEFDHTVHVIQQGYAALQCAQVNPTAPTLGPTVKP